MALRNFARSFPIFRECGPQIVPSFFEIIKRGSRYDSSPKYDPNFKYPEFEVSKNPEEWKYVEQLLPKKTIPLPKVAASVGGWKAQSESAKNLPYFVHRTKSHMHPVYLHLSHRNMRKVTIVRKIDGDIHALEKELKAYLETKTDKPIMTQVNEFAGYVRVKMDVVTYVKEWLYSKGL